MTCKNRAAENPGNHKNPICSTNEGISEKIRKWAVSNLWYETGAVTNQLKLEQTFGHIIEALSRKLKLQYHYMQRRQLFLCWDKLMAKCRQIDMICRAGCRDHAEMLELEFLRSKAIAAAAELAEVVEIIQNEHIPCPKPPDHIQQEDEWITFTQAAETLAVCKGTVSKWTKEGKFKDNAMKGQKRRLSKLSVLLMKQKREENILRNDLKELKEDARHII